MKKYVWILTNNMEYEGSIIIAIFDSKPLFWQWVARNRPDLKFTLDPSDGSEGVRTSPYTWLECMPHEVITQ